MDLMFRFTACLSVSSSNHIKKPLYRMLQEEEETLLKKHVWTLARQKDIFLCQLLQAAYSGLLKLNQTFTGAGVLHFDLPLTLLCTGQEQHINITI